MKKLFSVLLILCALTGVFSGLCMAESDENALPGAIVDLSYIDDGNVDHKLDIFLDEEAATRQPLILEIHGGGFFGGTKETNTAHAQVYQNAGFAVAVPNYTHMPEAGFKEIIGEVFTFLHWVEENADTYSLDMDNVFMSGDSAGGFIVLLTASVLSSPELQTYYEVTPPAFAIRGYALTCPVTDLSALSAAYDEGKGFVGFMAGQMGEAVLKDEESVGHADLYQLIDAATFPMVYFLTTPTDANFYADSVKLDAFLTENGIDHIYREYVGTEGDLAHVFNVSTTDTADAQQANGDIVAYLKSLMDTDAAAVALAEGEEGHVMEPDSKVTVACVGDSITKGIGTDGKPLRNYPTVLGELLGEDYAVINCGNPGATLQDEGTRPYTGLPEYQASLDAQAQVYIIMLGTNDSVEGTWDAERYERQLGEKVDTYLATSDRVIVYLMTPPQTYVREGKETVINGIRTDVINDEICPIVKKVAREKGIDVIDLNEFTVDHADWFADGVHPTEDGYARVAQFVYEAIMPSLATL